MFSKTNYLLPSYKKAITVLATFSTRGYLQDPRKDDFGLNLDVIILKHRKLSQN